MASRIKNWSKRTIKGHNFVLHKKDFEDQKDFWGPRWPKLTQNWVDLFLFNFKQFGLRFLCFFCTYFFALDYLFISFFKSQYCQFQLVLKSYQLGLQGRSPIDIVCVPHDEPWVCMIGMVFSDKTNYLIGLLNIVSLF